MGNNEARAIGIDVRATIEKFGGNLEAIDDDHRLTQGIQIHKVFCDLPDELVVSQESAKIGFGHTKLSFAIFLEHPLLIFQLKGISENWKALWARWNFAPWARYILCCQNDDETQYVTEGWLQKLGERSERETKGASISINTTECTNARTTGRCRWFESHWFCLDLEETQEGVSIPF